MLNFGHISTYYYYFLRSTRYSGTISSLLITKFWNYPLEIWQAVERPQTAEERRQMNVKLYF